MRALMPVRLRGSDIRFIRSALDMNGREFAQALELTPETVSRWETGKRGIGGYSEKLLRHNVYAILHSDVKGVDYDPVLITKMKIIDMPEGLVFPPTVCRRVLVNVCNETIETWGTWKEAA